jgi:IS605 OrfB family transposase
MILTSEKRWIRPKFRTPQLDLVWNRDYSLVSGRTLFSVNTLNGRIKVGFCSCGVNLDGRFGTARLVYRHGKFFLHIPITNDIEEVSLSDIRHITGIDRGLRFLAASYDSDGNCSFYSGRKVREKRAHFKMLRKELQQVRTPSSRRRLKAIGNRENRYVRDVNHVISKALVSQNPDNTLFVLEDLKGIRSAAERVRVEDRYVTVSWPYYDLEQKLIYKAERNHQKVIKVDPKYTSQRCPICGHTAKANRDKRNHIFRCGHCGYTSNDDRIGAMNLCSMGIQYLAQSQGSISSLTGSQSTGPDVTAAAEAVTNMGGIMPTTMGQSQAPASMS